jgi:hypothetical protein
MGTIPAIQVGQHCVHKSLGRPLWEFWYQGHVCASWTCVYQFGGIYRIRWWHGFSMWFMRSITGGWSHAHHCCMLRPVQRERLILGPSGRMNFSGPANIMAWDKLSLDKESRKVLWEKSEEACGKFDME